MERPKGSWQPPQRQVTGEMLYAQSLWQGGMPIGYYSQLPDETREEFEAAAHAMSVSDEKPEILKLYEQHDVAPSSLSASCRALAEALLRVENPTGDVSHTRMALEQSPDQILAALQALQVADLLVDADEQLALPADEPGAYQGDLKKSAMDLVAVNFEVWQREHEYLLVNKAATHPKFPDDYVPYTGGERPRTHTLSLSFEYFSPNDEYALETLALTIDGFGNLHLSRNIDTQAYERAGRPNYKEKALENPSEAAITEFADFLARIVGDSPETVRQQEGRQFRAAIDQLPSELSKAYLNEWILNTEAHFVRLQMRLKQPEGRSLLDMLNDPQTSDEAHRRLVQEVEKIRTRRRESEARGEGSFRGSWQDIVPRD